MLREKLVELKRHLLEDAALVEDMIAKSIKGLSDNDEAMLLEIVNTKEPKANDYDCEIDEMCVELIAQYEPVARDLRMVIMIVKMNKDLERIAHNLERIADLATNIAEEVVYIVEGRDIKHHN